MKKDVCQRWYVYILECSDRSLYTGYTNNVEKRVAKHQSGKGAKYTRGRRPVKLAAVWEYPSKSFAMRWEYMIKQMSRTDKLDMIAWQLENS